MTNKLCPAKGPPDTLVRALDLHISLGINIRRTTWNQFQKQEQWKLNDQQIVSC